MNNIITISFIKMISGKNIIGNNEAVIIDKINGKFLICSIFNCNEKNTLDNLYYFTVFEALRLDLEITDGRATKLYECNACHNFFRGKDIYKYAKYPHINVCSKCFEKKNEMIECITICDDIVQTDFYGDVKYTFYFYKKGELLYRYTLYTEEICLGCQRIIKFNEPEPFDIFMNIDDSSYLIYCGWYSEDCCDDTEAIPIKILSSEWDKDINTKCGPLTYFLIKNSGLFNQCKDILDHIIKYYIFVEINS